MELAILNYRFKNTPVRCVSTRKMLAERILVLMKAQGFDGVNARKVG